LRQSFPLPAYDFAFFGPCSPFIPTRILLFPYSVLVCGQDFIFWFVMSLSQFMSCPFAGGVFGFSFFDISSWESSSQGLFLRLGLEFPISSSLLVFFCFQVWASLFGHLLLRHQCSLLFFPSIASSLILGLISHAFTYLCGLELIDSFAFCLGFLSSLSLCYFFLLSFLFIWFSTIGAHFSRVPLPLFWLTCFCFLFFFCWFHWVYLPDFLVSFLLM